MFDKFLRKYKLNKEIFIFETCTYTYKYQIKELLQLD